MALFPLSPQEGIIHATIWFFVQNRVLGIPYRPRIQRLQAPFDCMLSAGAAADCRNPAPSLTCAVERNRFPLECNVSIDAVI
jgi:hypothetical protein